MKETFLLLLICFHKIESKIEIDITMDSNHNAIIDYYGEEVVPATEDDIKSFFPRSGLYGAVEKYYKGSPAEVYFSKPTPHWGDLYERFNWEPVTKKIEVTYAKVKSVGARRAVVLKQDFDNPSTHSIEVDTELSQLVQNTVTTTWRYGNTRSKTVSLGFKFGLQIKVLEMSGSVEYSTTTSSSWGIEEAKSESTTVGSKHNVKAKLNAGESITADLSVSTGYLEIEVGYKMSLQGQTAVNYSPQHRGHYFYGFFIADVMESQNIPNEKIVVGTVKYGFNIDAKLRVSDKQLIGL